MTLNYTYDLVSRNCIWRISLIFFEVGIPNLVCICILGWGSVTYHIRVTVTLTSDLVLMIIVSGAYLLHYLRKESQFWCMNASCDDGVSCTILWVTVTLTSDLVFRKIVSGEYLLLLKVRIPNLCGCNFCWRSVTYHF